MDNERVITSMEIWFWAGLLINAFRVAIAKGLRTRRGVSSTWHPIWNAKQRPSRACQHLSAYVSIRQHTYFSVAGLLVNIRTVQWALDTGSALAEKVAQDRVGRRHSLGESTWQQLHLVVIDPLVGTGHTRKCSSHADTLILAQQAVFHLNGWSLAENLDY